MSISVIMSTYVREKPEYLDAALNSIWTEQSRKPDEIILVEDGPLTPDLYSIIDKWQDIISDAMIIIKNERNMGLAASLNKGIEQAHGLLIARMDSDDISCPERFMLQEKFMAEHPEVSILGGAIREFCDNGTLDNIRQYPQNIEQVMATLHKASPLAHPTVMFRRDVFDQGLRYSTRHYLCEDITLWFDAIRNKHTINNMPDIILHFRRNDSVIRRRSSEKAWSEFCAYNEGIRSVFGIMTTRYMYSAMRLAFRLMPTTVIKKIYDSKIRNLVTNAK